MRQDPEGYQYGVVTAEPGKLAFYRQKREGLDEFIEGEGETIEYDGKADRVKFIKRAELRRFRGATLSDEIVGQPDHLRQRHRHVHRGRRAGQHDAGRTRAGGAVAARRGLGAGRSRVRGSRPRRCGPA